MSPETRRTVAAAVVVTGLLIVVGCTGCVDGPSPAPVRDSESRSRIVSLLPAATEIVVELGGRDLLVARSDGDPATAPMEGLPRVGDPLAPSVEVLTDVRPDLILAWAGADREALRRVIPPDGSLVLLQIRSFQELRAAIDTVAGLLGQEGRGRTVIERLNADLDRARRVAAEDAPSVAWIVWPDPLILAGPGTLLDEALAYAGGKNVVRAGEGSWPTVSLETLVSRDPDVLIWPKGGGIPDPAAVGGAWDRITAFQDGRLLRIPADRFHVSGPGLGTATVRLARELAARSTDSSGPRAAGLPDHSLPRRNSW